MNPRSPMAQFLPGHSRRIFWSSSPRILEKDSIFQNAISDSNSTPKFIDNSFWGSIKHCYLLGLNFLPKQKLIWKVGSRWFELLMLDNKVISKRWDTMQFKFNPIQYNRWTHHMSHPKQNSMVDGLFRSRDVKGKYSLLVLPYYMNLTSHVLVSSLHPDRCFQSHSTKTAGLHPPNGRMNINGNCFFFPIL